MFFRAALALVNEGIGSRSRPFGAARDWSGAAFKFDETSEVAFCEYANRLSLGDEPFRLTVLRTLRMPRQPADILFPDDEERRRLVHGLADVAAREGGQGGRVPARDRQRAREH